jgi:integrase
VERRIEEYLAERLLRGDLAASSAPVIRSVLRRWLRAAPAAPKDWARPHVEQWLAGPNLRPATRKSMLTKLRPFCQWLIGRGTLRSDPTLGVRLPPVPRGAPRDLSERDVHRLIAVLPDRRAVLVVILMLQLGLRAGDLARARVEDVDVRHRSLHVRAKGGRGEPTHWAPIPTEAWALLIAWLRETGHTAGPIVRSYQRPHGALTPHTVSKMVGGWMRAAGLKQLPYDGVSGHALRHTFAQDVLDECGDLRKVQFGLGHATVRSTEIYTRREPPGLREAVEGRRYLPG